MHYKLALFFCLTLLSSSFLPVIRASLDCPIVQNLSEEEQQENHTEDSVKPFVLKENTLPILAKVFQRKLDFNNILSVIKLNIAIEVLSPPPENLF
ncbi:hypothetical protein [Croceivirga radicis]|uniref:hypothetical protein n=1 Tax=Croceivirga radicis TaxID=1929488 RepID=UPI001140B240|nr:hypothetical protein [Croceivirga radicis]